MNKRKIMLAVGVLLMVGLPTFAGGKRLYGRQFEAEDTSAALRVYNGFDEDVTFKVTGDSGSITCTVGTITTTLDISSGTIDIISELAAAMLTVSNSANRTLLKTDTDCGVNTTDTIDDELVATTLTIKAGRWGNAVNWTTTDTEAFYLYLPGSENGGPGVYTLVEKIMGTVTGTGNITLVAYINGEQVWESIIVSPRYVLATTATNDTAQGTTSDAVGPGDLNINLNMGINPSENLLIRALRGTSGTTGGMTAIIRYGKD